MRWWMVVSGTRHGRPETRWASPTHTVRNCVRAEQKLTRRGRRLFIAIVSSLRISRAQDTSEVETPEAAKAGDPYFVYEWVVESNSCSGISSTTYGARNALSETLVALGHGGGYVRPVSLIHDGEDWTYLRFPVKYRAIYGRGGVQWW